MKLCDIQRVATRSGVRSMNQLEIHFMSKKAQTKCPECHQSSEISEQEQFPFCSKRCAMVDLGRWLNEEFRFTEGTPSLRFPLKAEESNTEGNQQ